MPKPKQRNHRARSSKPARPANSPLPSDYAARKSYPLATGVLDYFPDALLEVARVSQIGNDQHNPGEDLHWARGKSMDQLNTMMRHYMERGTIDVDGARHTAKMCWRALAALQEEIEKERGDGYISRGSRKAPPAAR